MGRLDSGGVVDPAARDKYLLQVTAGPSYDSSTHQEVAVNSASAHIIENDIMTCYLHVKIRDYHGLPRGSPSSSDYFSHPLHTSDRYSIGFSFAPKKDIKGSDLVTGFDFDHSIKDRLPPGFRYAMRIVTTILDPGIYSDPYSDKPYLYGPALSSFFAFRIGERTSETSAEDQLATQKSDSKGVIEEGADGSGQRIRADHQIPAKISKRRKNFLDVKKQEDFIFEAGRMYHADFFNPYLDFANFALRIPGFSISVVRYIDDKTHQLRYVLKNRATEEVLFVVIFTLLFGQSLEDKLESERAEETQKATNNAEMSDSDSEHADRETRHEKATAANTLANSIYSGFAALGFGRTPSTSGSEATSKSTSPEREKMQTKTNLDKKVDEMGSGTVEEYLKTRNSTA
ncbi:DUF1769-domain-containing protein [Lentithecium fluviatile CBS 122367]|uniref:DUF1769-domain-containing protein n=1 Tax=Lentithecium fluviatile CBS 122367 TaxID=1168545 RepID=A0A6G1ISJ0_9PLEO|nr:DUF1769-domain-containing protein [Lentithecium fluviatile CBS 122367]